jgi:hypothetical protein
MYIYKSSIYKVGIQTELVVIFNYKKAVVTVLVSGTNYFFLMESMYGLFSQKYIFKNL